MSKNIPDFSGFPTDNSSSTNLKYDIIASKFMTGIENHKRNLARTPSFGASLGLVEVIIQLGIALIVFIVLILKWIYKKL